MTTETAPRTAPLEPTTPIRPSEAIRLGCLVAPVQAFGTYVDPRFSGSACAVGAMALGFGAKPGWEPPLGHIAHPTIELTLLSHGCPECRETDSRNLIPHLNDMHRWSRERIADWLEGLGL